MSRPIEMSRTNAKETSVSLQFYVRFGADVPVDGVVEVEFPQGFTYTSSGGNIIRY